MTSITNPNGSMTVRWPAPFTDYVLQQSTDLTPECWADSLYLVSDDSTGFIPFDENGFIKPIKITKEGVGTRVIRRAIFPVKGKLVPTSNDRSYRRRKNAP